MDLAPLQADPPVLGWHLSSEICPSMILALHMTMQKCEQSLDMFWQMQANQLVPWILLLLNPDPFKYDLRTAHVHDMVE